jgi:hypothetical protein
MLIFLLCFVNPRKLTSGITPRHTVTLPILKGACCCLQEYARVALSKPDITLARYRSLNCASLEFDDNCN